MTNYPYAFTFEDTIAMEWEIIEDADALEREDPDFTSKPEYAAWLLGQAMLDAAGQVRSI
jgi:hypothetical protein